MRRLFGTNGIRGVIGDSMGPSLAMGIGASFSAFLGSGKRIAVGMDSRASGEMLARAFSSGAMSVGCSVVELGMLPTPAVQYYAKSHQEIGGGAIITASHNPPKFNGIKCVGRGGMELPLSDEEEIERIYFSRSWKPADWRACGDHAVDDTAQEIYVARVVGMVDRDAISRKRPRVILDNCNGASCNASSEALRILGCEFTTLNSQPDGSFPGRMPEPTEDNLRELIALCRKARPDVGIAHDGDGDRATFVDDMGRYVPGDEALAILAADAVGRAHGGIVVTPVDTSLVVDEAVRAAGGKVDYTAIGSPIVTGRMREVNAIFGGEGNGGLVFPGHQHCRDGLMSAAAMLDLLARSEIPLSSMVDALPKFERRKAKVECAEGAKADAMGIIDAALGNRVSIRVDGLKIVDADGWALIRTSGTEPIIRVVAESRDSRRTEEMAGELKAIVSEAVRRAEGLSRK